MASYAFVFLFLFSLRISDSKQAVDVGGGLTAAVKHTSEQEFQCYTTICFALRSVAVLEKEASAQAIEIKDAAMRLDQTDESRLRLYDNLQSLKDKAKIIFCTCYMCLYGGKCLIRSNFIDDGNFKAAMNEMTDHIKNELPEDEAEKAIALLKSDNRVHFGLDATGIAEVNLISDQLAAIHIIEHDKNYMQELRDLASIFVQCHCVGGDEGDRCQTCPANIKAE